jgi:Late competence development protein ComFB
MGAYRNAMEVLVQEEVEKQVRALPARSTAYINRLELIAYALNQLPSLYATSEKGFEYQVQRGRSKFGDQIVQAVRRALAAVRRDPLRTYAPLQTPQQSAPLREVLNELRLLLKNDKVDWDTLPREIERALSTSLPRSHSPSRSPAQPRGITWDARYEATPPNHSTPNPTQTYPTQTYSTHRPVASRQPSYSGSPYPKSPYSTTDSEFPVTQLQAPPPPPPLPRPPQSPPEPQRKAISRPEISSDAPPYGWDDPFYTM